MWLCSYVPVVDVERSTEADAIAALEGQYTSRYRRRQQQSGEEGAQRAAATHISRLGEAAVHLQRVKNVLFVPFSQAAKAVFFLASSVTRPVWDAERKARRVVSQGYAREVLEEMRLCRPRPVYELAAPAHMASIAFDQTYLKAAGGTGRSQYSAVQTVDAQGRAVHREKDTYINGQHFLVPLAAVPLTHADWALIAQYGPYTQDFARVLPLLDPARLDGVMDGFLQRGVGLLRGRAPASTREAVLAVLSRPNADPGGPTYLTYMHPPLMDTDTKAHEDMIKIVEWAERYHGCIPYILHLIGDGQSCLSLRELKRRHPSEYKHVLIGNGHLHSGAHSTFADLFLWWNCLLCMCMVTIGKVECLANGELRGTVLPTIKNLERNSTKHALQGLLPVAVAILLYFSTVVTSPPPELFLSDPVMYIELIENAGGIVLAQFLRHSGLPTLFWQRGTRGMEGETLDNLHCLALHKFRVAHKTSSVQISLLHLISIYCTHPKLRAYLRARLFVSSLGHVGASIATDKSVENQNEFQAERAVGQSLLGTLQFTPLLQPMHHVQRVYKRLVGVDVAADDGVRTSTVNEVDALVRLFKAKLGTDLRTYTTHNPFWHTGNPVNLRADANLKQGRPWEWIWRHAAGLSAGHRGAGRPEAWGQFVRRHLQNHMFYM